MKVAIFGVGVSMAWLNELTDIVKFVEAVQLTEPESIFDELLLYLEWPPLVIGYHSREERSVIWASALRQFRRWCTYLGHLDNSCSNHTSQMSTLNPAIVRINFSTLVH